MPIVTTDTLHIDYADDGPRDGPVALLLHGWPDDRSSWDAVAAALNDADLRTIVPYAARIRRRRASLSPSTAAHRQ